MGSHSQALHQGAQCWGPTTKEGAHSHSTSYPSSSNPLVLIGRQTLPLPGVKLRPKRHRARLRRIRGPRRIQGGDSNLRRAGTAGAVAHLCPLRTLRLCRTKSFRRQSLQTNEKQLWKPREDVWYPAVASSSGVSFFADARCPTRPGLDKTAKIPATPERRRPGGSVCGDWARVPSALGSNLTPMRQ